MKIMQIGVGGFGKTWLRAISKNDAATMVALVDLNSDALQKACDTYGWSPDICFTDLAEALRQTDAELAVVVTPPRFHRDPVITALRAGLDVVSEKPMAESIEDCQAMMQAAEETGRTYTVSQNYRYRPEFMTMARLIREGRIGTIGQVKIDFYKGHDFGGGFRHEMDNPILIDMSIHHFDLIRFLTGLNAESVRGSAWNPSWSNYAGNASTTVHFTLNEGVNVLYNASWCAKGQFSDWNGNWQIEGEKGTLLYANGEVTYLPVEGLYTAGPPEIIDLDHMSLTSQSWVLDHLMTSKANGVAPQTVCTDNIHSVRMVFAAVEAVDSGKEVRMTP